MHDDSYQRLAFSVAAALAIGASGCGSDSKSDDPDFEPVVAQRESRSSTIALTEDGNRVAMVNPEDGSLSVFATADNTRLSKIATGKNPSSVVITADGKTAFVANRGDGTVVRVTGIDGGTPVIDAEIEVGAEPVALALSPTGKRLYVAEFAESRVSVIDTTALTVALGAAIDRPRALLVTNDTDADDDDERVFVTQFYGEPVPGREMKDDGRIGKVRVLSPLGLAEGGDVTLAPIDAGFANLKTAPNQLAALAVANGKLFVTSVSASPEAPARFDQNVYPVVYQVNLESLAQESATNLARKIVDANPTPSPTNPRFIPGELSDIAFVEGSNVAYVVGRAGDVMVRVTFGSNVEVGSTQNKQIDLAGNDQIGKCQNPIGVAIDSDRQRAYVNCWITRRLGVVDLGAQSLVQTVEAAPPPANAVEASVQRGRRFYFTGRGRWSNAGGNGPKGGEGWSSCGSCHPDGLSDNITWQFAAGPRQSTSQDGSFSHGPGAQKQRIFNWTGIFDEHHDFERNTRDVSGGLGAITSAPTLADCNQLDKETQVSLAGIGGLAKPLKELQDDATTALCGHKDWDDIDNFVKTIQPVAKLRTLDAAAVDRGRQVFVDGGCAKCHGGAGWTVSRRMFTPAQSTNANLAQTPFTRPAFFPSTWMYDNNGQPRSHISAQPAVSADATGPAEPAPIAIAEVACVLRNVGTFGVPGDIAATDALELRPGNLRAEGRAGFNVPSLYGLALGAPYLHHGQSPSLKDLFTNTRWQFHTNAGNANMSVVLAQPGKLDDLIAFLLSIDATTPELAVPTDPGTGGSFDACP